jgi:hypothetical protein
VTPGSDRGNGTSTTADSVKRAGDEVVGESRWPMAGAVLAAMVLTILLPGTLRLGPQWVLSLIEGLLLVAVVAADPVRISRRSRELRVLSIVLVSVLVFGALSATVQLIDDLIHGGAVTNSASELLEAGTVVWVSNNIAFALLYWEARRRRRRCSTRPPPSDARRPRLPPATEPEDRASRLAAPVHRLPVPGLTNATAFSPTDVMPLAPWAKIAMALQAFVSLGILGLVIARAVNVFS